MNFTIQRIPDLNGKTIVITGANSGLGLESAKALAAHGALVIVGSCSQDKADAAVAQIQTETPSATLQPLVIDLADLSSVRAAADEVRARHPRLDVLMNNAGIMAVPYSQTRDGFELQFGTNHLGHFALTGLLFDLLKNTPSARVVTVSSGAHRMGKLRFDDLRWERAYAKWPAYGMSKLANLLFTYELARRAKLATLSLIAVAAHPGYAATNLQFRGPELAGSKVGAGIMRAMNAAFGQTAAMGALPQLYAAVAPDVISGDYIGAGGLFEASGYPKKVK